MRAPTTLTRIVWLAAALGLAARGHGQNALLVFDVSTVKLSRALTNSAQVNFDSSKLYIRNLPLKSMLMMAYGVREGLISGLPGWADSARYDVDAKVTDPDPKIFNDDMTREQRRQLMANLLAERFHLKVHTEVRTLPVYELVIAKGGIKFKESPEVAGSDPNQNKARVNTSRSSFDASFAPMPELTTQLGEVLGRTIIDKTGLTGKYDLHLKYAANGAPASDAADAPPDLFTAIEEQLGLKLQPAKGPVQTLVVDHVEQPTEN
jgi:uncharacterized protein (TIGR03435 family)